MDNFLPARRYPLVILVFVIAVGILFSLYCDYNKQILLIVAVCLSLICGIFLIVKRESVVLSYLLLILAAAFAAIRSEQCLNRDVRWKIKAIADSTDLITLYGRVESYEGSAESFERLLLSKVVIQGKQKLFSAENLLVRVYVTTNYLHDIKYGDNVVATGHLKSASEYCSVSKNQFVHSLINQETAVLYADSDAVKIIHRSGYFYHRWVDNFRIYVSNTFDSLLSADGAAVCKALLLGDRGSFSREFTDKVRLTGLSHIFALSGMNVGLIISILWLMMSLFFLPNQIRLSILILVSIFYMEVGRESPSLVRASLMCILFLFGRLIQRHGEIINFVTGAACIELLWRPLDLFDAGFQLSYLAVVSILIFYQTFYVRISKLVSGEPRDVRGIFTDITAGTIASQIGTIPLIGVYFGRIPFLGIVANVIAVPGFAILLIWSILLLIVQVAIPNISFVAADSINFIVLILNWTVNVFSIIPFSGLGLPDFSVWYCLLIYSFIACAWYYYLKRTTVFLASLLIAGNVFVWSWIFFSTNANSRLSFIDVGNGDAILLSTSSDKHVLIDTGPAYDNWTAASRIVSYLNEQRIETLDAVILTHPDNDHIGGTTELANRTHISNLYFNNDSSYSRKFTELKLDNQLRGVTMRVLRAGDKLSVDANTTLSILYPDSLAMTKYHYTNQRGIVCRVDCGESSALFTADIDSLIEKDLMSWGKQIDTDLLKAAHHGSGSSSCLEFIASVSPEFAVITAGRRNIYGHPSEEVINRFRSLNIPVYVTGKSGTIVFETHGNSWKRVETKASDLAKQWRLPYV